MKERIDAEKGAPPSGPYSPAVRANGLIFVSGQIPLNPETGEIVGDSIQDQVRQTLVLNGGSGACTAQGSCAEAGLGSEGGRGARKTVGEMHVIQASWVIPQSQLLRNTTHTSPHTMLLEELSRFSKGRKREDTWRNSNLPKNLYYA